MNKFNEIRNSIYNPLEVTKYPMLFMEKYIEETKDQDKNKKVYGKKISQFNAIDSKKKLNKSDIEALFSLLEEGSYLSRYAVDILMAFYTRDLKEIYAENLKTLILNEDTNQNKLYHLIELCIECKVDCLSDQNLSYLLKAHRADDDVLSTLMSYIQVFKRDKIKDDLYALIQLSYPETLKFQMIELLMELYSLEDLDLELLEKSVKTKKNKVFFEDYLSYLQNKKCFSPKGLVILQSMFYGDFEDSGKGNNGGLAVLLKSLGNEIAEDENVDLMVTITLTDKLTKSFISHVRDNHVFIRLPMYLNRKGADPFIKRELSLKRYIKKFLEDSGLNPEIYHVRYLDNASRAVAHVAKELNKKLVLTLTPDPHRSMVDESGKLEEIEFNEMILKLNKIKIGDELILISDGIIGIGDHQVKAELRQYFPQFKEKSIRQKVKMIGEGIMVDPPQKVKKGKLKVDEENCELKQFILENQLDEEFFSKPIILNVGRLATLKGQVNLLKAWANSKLKETHHLLIIGGDKEDPSEEERNVLEFFNSFLEENPQLKNNFFHKEAMTNDEVRILEKSIMKQSFEYPHLYLCSSLKEEFGLAILEAMSQGFLALGPISGGVKSYLNSGENGFLIETSSWQAMAKDTERFLFESSLKTDDFNKIQKAGRQTIIDSFSVQTIAQDFLAFYLALEGAEYDEI